MIIFTNIIFIQIVIYNLSYFIFIVLISLLILNIFKFCILHFIIILYVLSSIDKRTNIIYKHLTNQIMICITIRSIGITTLFNWFISDYPYRGPNLFIFLYFTFQDSFYFPFRFVSQFKNILFFFFYHDNYLNK